MANSDTLEFIPWMSKVKKTIHEDWMDLIEDNDSIKCWLDTALEDLHHKYNPRANGKWDANPRWTEMFNWTSCPVDDIQAMILLKGPSAGKNTDYEATGYGVGVRRKSQNNSWQKIDRIPTIWNMFKICNQVFRNPAKNLDIFKHHYRHGFNPKALSQKGILFLNMELTRRKEAEENDNDRYIWNDFILGILEAIPSKDIPIPVFQWYANKPLVYVMDRGENTRKFILSKPSCMELNEGPGPWHIWKFDDEDIEDYVQELKGEEYHRHRVILKKLFFAFLSNKLRYPAPVSKKRALPSNTCQTCLEEILPLKRAKVPDEWEIEWHIIL